MSDITVINDSQQSELVTNGLAKNGELYLKASGSTNAGSIIVYDSGSWRTFANDADSFSNDYSIDLDGANDYIDLGNDSSLSISGALSITAWIKPDGLHGYPMFVSKRASASGHAYQFYSNSGRLNYNNGTIVQSSGSLTTGSWQHIAVTFNGSGAVSFYINGSSAGTATAASSNPTNSGSVSIGRAYNGNYFNGKIDEVAMFNSELSSSDITSIYNSGVPNNISSLSPLGWWRMGENNSGTGTTITDLGSGGNNGTLINGPTFSTDVPS